MSFQKDPYKHFNIKTVDGGITFQWECESCGEGSDIFDNVTVLTLYWDFCKHVWQDHRLTKEDTKDWSP